MKARMTMFCAALTFSGCVSASHSQQAASGPPDKLTVTIDTQQRAAAVSPYEYGMFIEHIGSTMYSSLWDEISTFTALRWRELRVSDGRRSGGRLKPQC